MLILIIQSYWKIIISKNKKLQKKLLTFFLVLCSTAQRTKSYKKNCYLPSKKKNWYPSSSLFFSEDRRMAKLIQVITNSCIRTISTPNSQTYTVGETISRNRDVNGSDVVSHHGWKNGRSEGNGFVKDRRDGIEKLWRRGREDRTWTMNWERAK